MLNSQMSLKPGLRPPPGSSGATDIQTGVAVKCTTSVSGGLLPTSHAVNAGSVLDRPKRHADQNTPPHMSASTYRLILAETEADRDKLRVENMTLKAEIARLLEAKAKDDAARMEELQRLAQENCGADANLKAKFQAVFALTDQAAAAIRRVIAFAAAPLPPANKKVIPPPPGVNAVTMGATAAADLPSALPSALPPLKRRRSPDDVMGRAAKRHETKLGEANPVPSPAATTRRRVLLFKGGMSKGVSHQQTTTAGDEGGGAEVNSGLDGDGRNKAPAAGATKKGDGLGVGDWNLFPGASLKGI